jgi:hypothetical protein
MTTEKVIEVKNQEITLMAQPAEVVEQATRAARSLTSVVSRKPKKVVINNEQYLEYEDWQTIGQFYGAAVLTEAALPVEVEGVRGAKASARLISLKTGEVIGGAEAYCMRDEPTWSAKPWFQLASMAQTRAGAKALRNRLGWVAVLAGYKITPAEEMAEVSRSRAADKASAAQLKKIYASARAMGYQDEEMHQIIVRKYAVASSKDLTRAQAAELIEMVARGEELARTP